MSSTSTEWAAPSKAASTRHDHATIRRPWRAQVAAGDMRQWSRERWCWWRSIAMCFVGLLGWLGWLEWLESIGPRPSTSVLAPVSDLVLGPVVGRSFAASLKPHRTPQLTPRRTLALVVVFGLFMAPRRDSSRLPR